MHLLRILTNPRNEANRTNKTNREPMNNNVAIKVEHLSKRYRIGQYVGSEAQYKTPREVISSSVASSFHWLQAAVRVSRDKKQEVEHDE